MISTDIYMADKSCMMAWINDPAQSRIISMLNTTASFISARLRQHQSNFGIFLRIWSFILAALLSLHILTLCIQGLLCKSTTSQNTRYQGQLKCAYICARVCRGRTENEDSCLFFCMCISQKKAMHLFSLDSFVKMQQIPSSLIKSWKVSYMTTLMFERTTSKSNQFFFCQFCNFHPKPNKKPLY